MYTFLTKTFEKINWKHWLCFLLLSQSIYVLMLSTIIPKISREAGGMKTFDMMPLGYSYNYANSFLSLLTEQGYHLYKYVQLPLDIFFPIFNFGAGFCMLVLLLRSYSKLKRGKRPSQFLLWISLFFPLIALVFDYSENILIFTMLSIKENVPIMIVSTANVFTIIKSMSTTIFYCICLLIVLMNSASWVQYKIREKKTVGKLQYSGEEKSTIKDGHTR